MSCDPDIKRWLKELKDKQERKQKVKQRRRALNVLKRNRMITKAGKLTRKGKNIFLHYGIHNNR